MSMVGVTLEPSAFYDVIDLNEMKKEQQDSCEDENEDIELTFGDSYLNPMDTRQYLYQLKPKKESDFELKAKVSRFVVKYFKR